MSDNTAPFDPLLEGASSLLDELNFTLDTAQLAYGMPLQEGLLNISQLPELLARHDVSARLRTVRLSSISKSLLPCLIMQKDNSCLVLKAIDDEQCEVVNPATGGLQSIPRKVLEDQYSGVTLFAQGHAPLERAESYAGFSGGHWLRSRLAKHWRVFVEVGVASLVASLLAVATALFAMQVYDRVVPTAALDTLWALAIGVFIAIGFEFLLKSLRAQLIETSGKRLDLELSHHIFQQAVNLKLAHKPLSVGSMASQIRDFDSIREFFTASSLGACGDLPFVALFFALMAYIGGPLVWVPVGGVVLMLLPALLAQPWLSKLSREGMRESAVKNGVLLEALDNLETLKACRAEGRAIGLWQRLSAEQVSRGVTFRHASAWITGWGAAMQQLSYVVVVVAGVYLIIAGDLTVGALIACSILSSRAMSPTLQITGLLARWQHVKVAIEGLDSLMQKDTERPMQSKMVRLESPIGGYQLERAEWRYGEDQPNVLSLDQLTINAGEHVAFLGGNGAGKSTLLRLLAGLYSPSAGSVNFDNLALSQIEPADRRRAIGYLPQDIALFHGTLRENLTLDGRHAPDSRLLEVLEMVGLGESIRNHPQGLDMMLHDSQSLSGGQRQSVGLARLVLQDPKVVLLDEPTSALDQQTEQRVIAQLMPWLKGRTLILATHKKPLLAWTERAVVLRMGRRILDGSLTDVLAQAAQPAKDQESA